MKGWGESNSGEQNCSSENNCCSAKDKDELDHLSKQRDLAGGCSLAARSWRRLEAREGLVTDLCVCSPKSK